MTLTIIDDHLLRDVLTDQLSGKARRAFAPTDLATTNMFHVRLCKSVVYASGGRLTGSWPAAERRSLGRVLTSLPSSIEVVPLRTVAFRTAELAEAHRLSTLGAELLAAAELLEASVRVWSGDDGPHIRAAAAELGIDYGTLPRGDATT